MNYGSNISSSSLSVELGDAEHALAALAISISELKLKLSLSELVSLLETQNINRADKNESGSLPPDCDPLALSNCAKTSWDKVQALVRMGISFVTPLSDHYPKELGVMAHPPPILYYLGDITCIKDRLKVGIVGSRRAQEDSFSFIRSVAQNLANKGAVIVSGLALGIDTAGHIGALDSELSGSTVAVLGSPLTKIIPTTNQQLARKILDSRGCIISTYYPNTPVYPSNFLERNHLIAALSNAIIVGQAAKRSGSLATARNGLDYGREIFVVPGPPQDAAFVGSNELIKQGAYLFTEANDIMGS